MNPEQLTKTGALTEATNINHFDLEAQDYDDRFDLSVDQSRARVRHIKDHSERTIQVGLALDLGCGTGNLSAALVLEGAAESCIGVDISLGMLEIARRKTERMGSVTFRLGSATTLPFEDKTFDLVVGDAFLHHILDVESCLREVYRVLKPSGVATFNEPNGQGYALAEFIFRNLAVTQEWNDENLNNYLECLRFLRENRGNLPVLDAYPLPDKHFFSLDQISSAAFKAGFSASSYVPALGPSPTTWHDAFHYLLSAIKPAPSVSAMVLQAAHLLDVTLGEEARMHFCLHNQFYFYK